MTPAVPGGTGRSCGADKGPLIYLIVGEPSGDLLGARLMAALEQLTDGRVRFAGIGGPNMAARGFKTLFPIDELAVMGIVEILPHAFNIYRRIRQTRAAVLRDRPAVLVTIDSPSFTLEVAQRLKGRGIPLVHYVAPQVWAWKPWRARHIAGYLDLLLALLPFEPPYFEKHGLKTVFVGHPAVEGRGNTAPQEQRPGFRERFGIAEDARIVCMLPGSRSGEVSRLSAVFCAGLECLAERIPNLHVVIPTVSNVAALVRDMTTGLKMPVTVIEDFGEKYDAFQEAEAAIAASGTVAVELAVAGVPTVVGYRASAVTAWLARRLLRIRFASLPNLLLDRELFSELLQERLTPETIAAKLYELLEDPEVRQAKVEGCREVVQLLTPPGESPSMVAARRILAQIQQEPSEGR